MRRRLNFALVVAITTTISVLSLVNPGEPGRGVSMLAPVLHAAGYFLLAGALMLHFHDTDKGHLEAVGTAAGLGLLLEAVQFYLPYRIFSPEDVIVNAAGASLVVLDHRSEAVTRVVRIEDRLIERFTSR